MTVTSCLTWMEHSWNPLTWIHCWGSTQHKCNIGVHWLAPQSNSDSSITCVLSIALEGVHVFCGSARGWKQDMELFSNMFCWKTVLLYSESRAWIISPHPSISDTGDLKQTWPGYMYCSGLANQHSFTSWTLVLKLSIRVTSLGIMILYWIAFYLPWAAVSTNTTVFTRQGWWWWQHFHIHFIDKQQRRLHSIWNIWLWKPHLRNV